jgi:hypothetical protein
MPDDRAHCIGSRRTLKTELLLRPDYRLCSLNVIICTWKAAGELGDFLHTVVHGNPNNPKGPSFLSISLFVHL